MDIRNLKTFVRAAEMKSFTKVAQELNYVQSTVTMQIQQLERELGFPLFDRVGKTVSLTALGEAFLSYAYEILHIVQEASALDKDLSEIQGVLRVGLLESLLFGTMLELLPDYKAVYRNLDLQLKMGQTTELLQQLKQNRLDMVYLSADLNTDPELRCCYKRQEELVFLSNRMHPAAQMKQITPEQLLSYDFVVTERTGICYGRLQKLAAEQNMLLRDSVEVDSTVAIISLVQKGLGLAFLPEYAVKKELQAGTLVKLDVAVEPQKYYSQILCHKKRWISPFMAGLIRVIRENRPDGDPTDSEE